MYKYLEKRLPIALVGAPKLVASGSTVIAAAARV
jgi:hypothetical protein